MLRIEAMLAEEALVVRRGAAGVAHDTLEPLALQGEERLARQPLGALEFVQDL